ncbi:signal recognition particle protein [Chloroflexota bacterium]
MFEILSEKLGNVFRVLSGRGRLSEKDIDDALRKVRLALLEADVNFKVVREFVARIRERVTGADVLESLSPGQQIIKVVNEELVCILGEESRLEPAPKPPGVVMMVGLQGSGKTTTAAKLGLHLTRQGQKVLLVAADNRRPAAIEQLVALGRQLEIPVHSENPEMKSRDICVRGVKRAAEIGAGWVILDTAGRLQIDDQMMDELDEIKKKLKPAEVLLVVDAMTGQEAVNVASEFHARAGVTGLVLSKMDGDARGGAALSVRWVTGVPIKFMGVGEKTDALEVFHPERLASRILGMGDILTLIEKAEAAIDQEKVKELEKKVRTATFDLEDFLEQLRSLRKMGPVSQIMEMMPGMGKLSGRLPAGAEEAQLQKVEAVISSMTPEERHKPNIIGGSRRRRIARGSGLKPQDVNQVLNQFGQIQKLMKMGAKGKLPRNIMGMFT